MERTYKPPPADRTLLIRRCGCCPELACPGDVARGAKVSYFCLTARGGRAAYKSRILLQDGSDAPGSEFVMTEEFGTGAFAGCDGQQLVENLAADLLDGARALGDTPGVHVHVVAHAVVSGRVTRNFQHRHAGEADGAAAAGGKGDQVDAARRQAGN